MTDSRKVKFNDEFDFKLFLNITRKSLIYIIVFTVLLFAAVFVYLRYTQPVYEAACIVQINTDDKAEKLFDNKTIYEDDIYRKIEIMRSPVFMQRVVSQLPLGVSVFAKGNILNFELYNEVPFEIKYEIIDSAFYGVPLLIDVHDTDFVISEINSAKTDTRFRFHEPVSLPQVNFVFTPLHSDTRAFFNSNRNKQFIIRFNNLKDIAAQYSQQVNIAVINDVAKTIRISLKDFNPRKAADIVNCVAKEFAAFEVEYQKNSSSSILEFIDSQLGQVEENLDETKDSMQQTSLPAIDSTLDRTALQSRLFELDNLISVNASEVESLEVFYKVFSSGNADIITLLPLISGIESQVYLSPYLQSLKDLEMRKQELLLRVTENSTAIESINAQIEFQNKIIRESTTGLLSKYKRQHQRYLTEKNNILRMLGKPLVGTMDDQSRIERYYSVNEKFYNQLIEKKIEYSIAQAGYVSQLIVLQPAQSSFTPVSPNNKLIWIGSFIFAIVVSFAFLILRYILYNEVVSLRDVKKLTTVPVLGVIPKYKSYIPVSQLIVDTRPRSLLAEALRAIRTNLQFIKNITQAKVIAISSTVSGEGKTFVAINFAGVLAFNNKNVIVLDFDLRKPKIHVGFNTDNEKGVSSILLKINTPEECIRHSSIPNLHFITAGPTPINPSELILTNETDELITYLKTKYDYIIMDTPPIGLVSDAMKPLQYADYPIYVVRANYSKRSYIYNIEKLYHENNLRFMSIILNNVDPEITGAGSSQGFAYGYGYGYGYNNSKHGYYDSEDSVKKSWKERLKEKFRRKR